MKYSEQGGPAFPCVEEHINPDGPNHIYHLMGMTLRDYFAGQALTGMLAYYNPVNGDYHTNSLPDGVAESAWNYADHMILLRDKKSEE